MQRAARPEVIPVWPDGVPATETESQQEQESIYIPRFNNRISTLKVVRNVPRPTLTAFLPDPPVANGSAVIVCPGGGFHFLPIDNEGTDVAQWLTTRGVAAFVLRYRLLPTAARDKDFVQQVRQPDWEQIKSHAPRAVMDGKQAMRVVRERAATWGIDPQRIGVLGFSAGGVVATGVATQYEADSRPNFAALLYSPVWQDLAVAADAPPLFLAFANDDPAFSLIWDGILLLYPAWKAAGHPIELHAYSKGGHGFGMTQQGLPSDHWIERFGEWLQVQSFLA
jgi:acetyl esterase/lipase